jgi:hypothetical protein
MAKRDVVKWWFAIVFLVAIPAMVHAIFEGAYVVTSDGQPVSYKYVELPPNSPAGGKHVANPDPGRRGYWIGPVSSTLPFIFLALLFLAHCFDLKSRSRKSAYCGAIAAWLSMMGFTIFIIAQYRSPHLSSTAGIGIMLAPFRYIPFLFLPYIVGTIIGVFWSRRENQGTKM